MTPCHSSLPSYQLDFISSHQQKASVHFRPEKCTTLFSEISTMLFRPPLSFPCIICRQQTSGARTRGSAFLPRYTGFSSPRFQSRQANQPPPCCSKPPKALPPSASSREFWLSQPIWRRAGVNTFRCLVGCTLGDFSAMWYLQAFHPDVQMQAVMAISSNYIKPSYHAFSASSGALATRKADVCVVASGLSTSLLLETVLLKLGRDRLSWLAAAKTAFGMSMISMITMELVENLVDYHLTGGVVQLNDPMFWMAAAVSMTAGFLAPLPYNYHRLMKFGKACH